MSDDSASLEDLFSRARISLVLPTLSSSNAPSAPDAVRPSAPTPTVFFDQVLKVCIRLSLPAGPHLPGPSSNSELLHTSLSLPLNSAHTLPDQSSSSDLLPRILFCFLACLHIHLQSDYVPPPQQDGAGQLPTSTNPYEPLSTVRQHNAKLQLLPAHQPPATNTSHVALSSYRAFSTSWLGTQTSTKHDGTSDSKSKGKLADDASASVRFAGEHWIVEWPCSVPINFIATPFQPLLSLSAILTLRLDPVLINHLHPQVGHPHLRSGFSHSLLTPLHEGPIYPDESPSQSAARAGASAALGLDGPNGLGSYLAHLPRDVLGGKSAVITPRSGVEGLESIRFRRLAAGQGTVGYSSSSVPAAARQETNGDLSALSSDGKAYGDTQNTASQDQRPFKILKRSTREITALKTGLNVRMRTLFTPHDPFPSSEASKDDRGNIETPSLVLCVEIENPIGAGINFDISDIKIKIHSQTAKRAAMDDRLEAKLLQTAASKLPVDLKQGQQCNFLYYLGFARDGAQQMYPVDSSIGGSCSRNVTILVTGRPEAESTSSERGAVVEAFESQWNCKLDLQPLFAAEARKTTIARPQVASGSTTSSTVAPRKAAPVAGESSYSSTSLQRAHRNEQGGSAASNPQAPSSLANAPAHPDRTAKAASTNAHLGRGLPSLPSSSRNSHSRYDDPRFWHGNPANPGEARSSHPDFAQHANGGLLARARERAVAAGSDAARRSAMSQSDTIVGPWTSGNMDHQTASQRQMSSHSPTSKDSYAADTDGLVILCSIRRLAQSDGSSKDLTSGPHSSRAASTTLPRPEVIQGKKADVSIPVNGGAGGVFRAGDVVSVDVTLINRFMVHPSAISGITLSWSAASEGSDVDLEKRNSFIGSAAVKQRFLDPDAARRKVSLSSVEANAISGLIPLDNDVTLTRPLRVGESRKMSLQLLCLTPGFHQIPALSVQVARPLGIPSSPTGARLIGLGAVQVEPIHSC